MVLDAITNKGKIMGILQSGGSGKRLKRIEKEKKEQIYLDHEITNLIVDLKKLIIKIENGGLAIQSMITLQYLEQSIRSLENANNTR